MILGTFHRNFVLMRIKTDRSECLPLLITDLLGGTAVTLQFEGPPGADRVMPSHPVLPLSSWEGKSPSVGFRLPLYFEEGMRLEDLYNGRLRH